MYDGNGNLPRDIVNGVVTFYPGRQTNREVTGANVTVRVFSTYSVTVYAINLDFCNDGSDVFQVSS